MAHIRQLTAFFFLMGLAALVPLCPGQVDCNAALALMRTTLHIESEESAVEELSTMVNKSSQEFWLAVSQGSSGLALGFKELSAGMTDEQKDEFYRGIKKALNATTDRKSQFASVLRMSTTFMPSEAIAAWVRCVDVQVLSVGVVCRLSPARSSTAVLNIRYFKVPNWPESCHYELSFRGCEVDAQEQAGSITNGTGGIDVVLQSVSPEKEATVTVKWKASDAIHGSIAVPISFRPVPAPKRHLESSSFEVQTTTGKVDGSGTGSTIKFRLIGVAGVLHEQVLENPGVDVLENGQVDAFTLNTANPIKLSDVTGFELQSVLDGKCRPDWLLDRIVVRALSPKLVGEVDGAQPGAQILMLDHDAKHWIGSPVKNKKLDCRGGLSPIYRIASDYRGD